VRIVVASTYVPFLKGDGTRIVEDLSAALTTAGHKVETVMIPVSSCWPRIPEQTLAIRLLDLTESCGNRIDRLIAVRYPSYALSHPEKVVWFVHHHRAAYDMWGTPWSDMPDAPEGRAARRMMMQSDETYLREAKKVYTISRNVSGRLRRFNGIEADGVLYPPLPADHPYVPGPFGDYFVYISRLCQPKRQSLAIEAFRYCRPGPRLLIVGSPNVPEYLAELHDRVRDCGVEDRVQFVGWASETQKAELLAGSRGALFLAYDEDHGYATLEALHSGKPVITCKDSGASLELIEDGFNGLVTEPDPRAVAEAMDRLWADRTEAEAMGRQALLTPEELGISWQRVVEGLGA
jgi:glycosyltransferase involved in cell wall biosynthesis